MTRLSRNLEELSRALIDLDTEAMLLEELDGFIAGLIVCPEMIPPALGCHGSGTARAIRPSRCSRTSPTSIASWV